MATPVHNMPVEVSAGDLETRYLELGEMAIRHARVPAGTDFGPCCRDCPTIAAQVRTGASCSRARSRSCTPTALWRSPAPARSTTGLRDTRRPLMRVRSSWRSAPSARCGSSTITHSRSSPEADRGGHWNIRTRQSVIQV